MEINNQSFFGRLKVEVLFFVGVMPQTQVRLEIG